MLKIREGKQVTGTSSYVLLLPTPIWVFRIYLQPRIAISDRVKNTGNDIRSNNRHRGGERDQGVNFRNAYNALTLCTAFPPFSQNFIAGKKWSPGSTEICSHP